MCRSQRKKDTLLGGTRVFALRRKFFATPLVSELPDGFGSNANLIRYTSGVRNYAWH